MEHQVDATLKAIAKSQEDLARLLHYQKEIVRRMSEVLRSVQADELAEEKEEHSEEHQHNIVDSSKEEEVHNPYLSYAKLVAGEISSYLHSLAAFEEGLADNVQYAVKELRITDEE